MSKKLLKRLGLALLIIPIGFLMTFLFGEVFSGDISGLSHLLQLAPLFALLFIAWKKPYFGGLLLIGISLLLGILYVVDGASAPNVIFLVVLSLFLPPFISGVLLLLSSKKV